MQTSITLDVAHEYEVNAQRFAREALNAVERRDLAAAEDWTAAAEAAYDAAYCLYRQWQERSCDRARYTAAERRRAREIARAVLPAVTAAGDWYERAFQETRALRRSLPPYVEAS